MSGGTHTSRGTVEQEFENAATIAVTRAAPAAANQRFTAPALFRLLEDGRESPDTGSLRAIQTLCPEVRFPRADSDTSHGTRSL